MADLLIDVTIKVNDVPTAAGATPVLRDAANAYGIKRMDTGAVVVAAGTAMTAGAATGQYSYTLPDAVADVVYAYVIEAVVNGSLIRIPGDRTLSPTSTLPRYLTVQEADAYAAGVFGLTAWAAASSADKLKALTTATARLDTAHRWQGRKVDADQALEFPRIDGRSYVAWDPSAMVPIVPMHVLLAVVIEADSILRLERAGRLAAQHDGLSAQSIGSASESYRPMTTSQGVPVLCKDADSLVDRYRLRSGVMR